MAVSDKEAYRVLGLPLGVHKDAICLRYKQMTNKLSASKSPEDRRKAELVCAAYFKLIPPGERIPIPQQNSKQNQAKNHTIKMVQVRPQYSPVEPQYSSSSEDDVHRGNRLQNGDSKNSDPDKRKGEKKKTKKKKKKGKKKQDKNEANDDGQMDKRPEDSDSEYDDNVLEESQGIDPNSAFVAVVGKKIGSNSINASISNPNHNLSTRHEDLKKVKTEIKTIDPTRQIQARQFAMLGNEEANKGAYDRAVRLFTQAVSLDPSDHRFFGNRSYCYDQLQLYDKALRDAEKAIKLSPEWPKGHFRKGRALKGLCKLSEAEASFQKVLRFDEGCEDAILEINKVRKHLLVEMGFTEPQARAAIKKYINFQPALDALCCGEFNTNLGDIFFSDDDEEEEEDFQQEHVRPIQIQPKDVKMNPRNLEGLTSLWVGNVVPDVSEKMLIKLFSKYGQVTSVRQLKEKYCAFVNYNDKVSAGRAMEGLQGKDVCGSKLLIKFPDNPIVNGHPNIIIRKNKNANVKSTT